MAGGAQGIGGVQQPQSQTPTNRLSGLLGQLGQSPMGGTQQPQMGGAQPPMGGKGAQSQPQMQPPQLTQQPQMMQNPYYNRVNGMSVAPQGSPQMPQPMGDGMASVYSRMQQLQAQQPQQHQHLQAQQLQAQPQQVAPEDPRMEAMRYIQKLGTYNQ